MADICCFYFAKEYRPFYLHAGPTLANIKQMSSHTSETTVFFIHFSASMVLSCCPQFGSETRAKADEEQQTRGEGFVSFY